MIKKLITSQGTFAITAIEQDNKGFYTIHSGKRIDFLKTNDIMMIKLALKGRE